MLEQVRGDHRWISSLTRPQRYWAAIVPSTCARKSRARGTLAGTA
jgi:hypothetical protein